MSSFPEFHSPSDLPWFSGSPAWRAILALAVVFVLLATTGWTAATGDKAEPGPRAAALIAWQDGSVNGRSLPDPEAGATEMSHFFDTLGAAQRTRLAERYPLVVGNLDGAPVTLRYEANHKALTQARKHERHRMHDEGLTALGREQASRRVDRFESLLSGNRQIMAFDPTGGGRAAEVFGDIERAQQVSVVVPGVDTNLVNFERTTRTYTAPVGMAQALYNAERAEKPEARTAVIAWADYTSPAGLGMDAALGHMAQEGAVRLNALVSALPGSSRISLFCHSYGSVVCGLAARELPGRVTDIAVAGSPGMRVEHAGDLGDRARVWATRDPDDWIQDVPNLKIGGLGHGTDPVSSGFGARVISAEGAVGHAGYFAPGTTSLANFAKLGVGAIDTVSCAGSDTDCTAGAQAAEQV